jgi:hypothetical protein
LPFTFFYDYVLTFSPVEQIAVAKTKQTEVTLALALADLDLLRLQTRVRSNHALSPNELNSPTTILVIIITIDPIGIIPVLTPVNRSPKVIPVGQLRP